MKEDAENMMRATSETAAISALAVPAPSALRPSSIPRSGSESPAPPPAAIAARHLPVGISAPAEEGSLPLGHRDAGWQDQFSAALGTAKQLAL